MITPEDREFARRVAEAAPAPDPELAERLRHLLARRPTTERSAA